MSLGETVRRIPLIGRAADYVYRLAMLPGRFDAAVRAVEAERAKAQERDARVSLLCENQRLLARELAGPLPKDGGAPPRDLGTTSRLCTQAQFLTPEYAGWCARMKAAPMWHRKQWEFVFAAQALWERGMLAPGKKGCGFGVGQEPLPALFAACGCQVLATDAPPAPMQERWRASEEYAASLEALNLLGIAEKETFRARVAYRSVDMNRLPADLQGFDFVWSCCALEHLGSLQNGVEFLLNSCRCLADGGVGVHTTEFNLHSNDATIEEGESVIYRRRDIEALAAELHHIGCELAPADLDPGDSLLDRYVAVPPYDPHVKDTPHLRMRIGPWVSTSIGLIIRKGIAS